MTNYNEQSFNFTLRSTDIFPFNGIGLSSYTQVRENHIGKITSFGSDVTFYLDLERIVGEEAFKKHQYFHLTMNHFMTIPRSNSDKVFTNKSFANDVNLQYLILNVWLSKPIFRLSSYNVETQNNEEFAHLGILGREQVRVNTTAVLENQFGNWRGDEFMFTSVTTYPNRDIIIEKQRNVTFRITFGDLESGAKTIPSTVFPEGTINSMQHFIATFSLTPLII